MKFIMLLATAEAVRIKAHASASAKLDHAKTKLAAIPSGQAPKRLVQARALMKASGTVEECEDTTWVDSYGDVCDWYDAFAVPSSDG